MLRAHYRETPKLQAGRSKKGKDNGSKEGRKKEKERKEEEVNKVAQVYHESHVARTFPKSRISQNIGIPKQHSLAGLSYRIFHHCSFTEHSARIGRV